MQNFLPRLSLRHKKCGIIYCHDGTNSQYKQIIANQTDMSQIIEETSDVSIRQRCGNNEKFIETNFKSHPLIRRRIRNSCQPLSISQNVNTSTATRLILYSTIVMFLNQPIISYRPT